MTPISVLIVEDEILIAETIKMYLSERGHTVTAIAISYDEAVASIQKIKPDVILLDVRLYGQKSGIDFAHYILEHDNIPFVFLTSQFDKRIVQSAMESNPKGYLTKPIQKESLWTTVELAHHHAEINIESDKIHIYDGQESYYIYPKDILYIKADHVYIYISLANQKPLIIRSSLSDMLDQLNEKYFIKCHRSYIVNLSHVQSSNNHSIMISENEIPVSRSRKKDVAEKLYKLNS